MAWLDNCFLDKNFIMTFYNITKYYLNVVHENDGQTIHLLELIQDLPPWAVTASILSSTMHVDPVQG